MNSLLDDYQSLKNFEEALPYIEQELQRWNHEINIFDILKIKRMEIRHSNFLAWLMNPNESHQFGDLFLSSFVRKINNTVNNNQMYDNFANIDLAKDYSKSTVYRERKHIDILIRDEESKLNIVIENKIDANETGNQLQEYFERIEKEFPVESGYQNFYIFLTPHKSLPSCLRYISLGYSDISELLEELLETARPINSKVEMLIKDYIHMLRRDIVKDEELIDLCNKIYSKHRRAIDLVNENRTDQRTEISEIMKRNMNELAYSRKLDGFIFDPKNSNKIRICFQTERMNEVLSYSNKGRKWEGNNYFYEIYNEEGEKIQLKLTITKNIREEWIDIVDQLKKIVEEPTEKDGYTFLREWDIPDISEIIIENSDMGTLLEHFDNFKEKFSKFYLEELIPFEKEVIAKLNKPN